MSYKLIVTDMDATLLGSDHQITSENKKALTKLLDKGISLQWSINLLKYKKS